MPTIVKDNPRSRPNGSSASLGRRTAPAPKNPANTDYARLVESLEKLTAGDLDTPVDNPVAERLRAELQSLSAEIRRMADEHTKGDIDVRISANRFGGSFQALALGVNEMVAGHIDVKKKAMACVDEFSKGNFDAPLERFAGKKAFINDAVERLRANTQSFITETQRMSTEHNQGDIDVSIPADQFTGDFRVMAKGVNEMVAGHIIVKKKAMACVAEFAKGNFDAPLERFPGKKAFINDNLELLRTNLRAFIADMTR